MCQLDWPSLGMGHVKKTGKFPQMSNLQLGRDGTLLPSQIKHPHRTTDLCVTRNLSLIHVLEVHTIGIAHDEHGVVCCILKGTGSKPTVLLPACASVWGDYGSVVTGRAFIWMGIGFR